MGIVSVDYLEFSEAELFRMKQKGFQVTLLKHFEKAGILVLYDAEAGQVPVRYSELFRTKFLPILQRNGISHILLEEFLEKFDNKYLYTLWVSDSKNAYEVQFENNSDFFENKKFVHFINKLLQSRAEIKKRFVFIDSGDQTLQFVFAEPGRIKLFTKKYNILTFIKNQEDDFSKF